MEKDFDRWNIEKKIMHSTTKQPSFNQGDIWLCRIGINVGFEVDGKDRLFLIPILILKKFGASTF